MAKKLEGKVAVVTGASKGIGAAIAEDAPQAVVTALDELNASPIPASCFERYIQDFGYPALSRRLDEALTRVLADD